MILLENTEVIGWDHAIRGMRNPLNSWDKIDSGFEYTKLGIKGAFKVGERDLDLMYRLDKAGTDHRKFMRMIAVYVDITAPLYWWKEFDTYKVGTVANSTSTMHKIHDKDLILSDFSYENLTPTNRSVLQMLIDVINVERRDFVKTKDKNYWWQIIQLLPTSYNQKRTVMLNYEVLANMYKSRKSHKLDEWIEFCEWVKLLPYSDLIINL